MKVFISWSGSRSRATAELLGDWIKCVIQATRPWISTRDIDRGALWFSEISDQLKDTTVGIVCLTQENKNRPWILFEAGALAKGLSSTRVCTLLVDLKPADLEDPLAQFNHTLPDREGMWALIRTLNTSLGSAGLDERILEQVFSTYWNDFASKFDGVLKKLPLVEKAEQRSERNLLGEILENTRMLAHRIRTIEGGMEHERLRELRGETNRSRLTNNSAVAVKRIINRMVAAGMPDEAILEELRGYPAPTSFVRRHLNAARVAPNVDPSS
jgi:hypothetical protein